MSWLLLFPLLGLLGLLLCLISLPQAIGGKWKIPINHGTNNKLPPGPPGLPILGNLLMLGDLPHHTFLSLAKAYGSIMYLRLGVVPTIVVSSPQSAQQILKTHDLTFASRPPSENGKNMGYQGHGVVLSPYGPYWRTARKLCTLRLLNQAKIHTFESTRREEMIHLLNSLKDAANAGAVVNLSSSVAGFTANVMCQMILSRRCMDEGLDEQKLAGIIQEILKIGGSFNLADLIPFVGLFDIQGLKRRMKACGKLFDEICENIISERIRNKGSRQQRDFVDIMLSDAEFQDRPTNIKGVIFDMLLAGVDTSATAIEWALSELFRHPRVMKKVQKELLQVVGMDRMVEESDLAKLVYLDMVIKETFRLHPVAPLLLPHHSMEDCTVDGFYIPKKSIIFINVYAIGRDPTVWSNAEEFLPERFIGTDIDVKGHDFELIPFGSGRRMCPGMQLGLTMIRLVLAQLMHCFDWELPNGILPSELDMSEEFGVTMPRANPLLAMPAYRLQE